MGILGTFLILGNAGFISSTVLKCWFTTMILACSAAGVETAVSNLRRLALNSPKVLDI